MVAFKPDRYRIRTMRAEGAAAHNPEQSHPAACPQAMTSNRFIGVFRTGRQMPAVITDKAGKGKLVKPHKPGTDKPAGRFAPRAIEIAGLFCMCGHCKSAPAIFNLLYTLCHGIKNKHGRGMACLVILHRLKTGKISEFPCRWRAIFRQHGKHCSS